MKNKTIRKKIKEICTYHSDGGTSGYYLSDAKFEKIFDLFDRQKQLLTQIIEGIGIEGVDIDKELEEGGYDKENAEKFYDAEGSYFLGRYEERNLAKQAIDAQKQKLLSGLKQTK